MNRFNHVLCICVVSACAILPGVETFRIGCYDGYAPEAVTAPFIKLVKDKLHKDITIVVTTVIENQTVYDFLRSNAVDVITPTNNCFKADKFKLISHGLLMPIDTATLSHYADILPELQTPEFMSEGGKTYGVPLNYGIYGLMYHSAKVQPAPTSWSAAIVPGMDVAVSKDWEQALIASVALAHGVGRDDVFTLEKVNIPAVRASLKTLGTSKRQWSGVDDAATLAGGDLAFGWGFALTELNQMGEPWKMAEPVEGLVGYVDTYAISAAIRPELKDVAMLWCDYVISPECQAFFFKSISVKPVNPKARNHLSAEEAVAAKVDDPMSFTSRVILLRPVSIRTENGLKRMWAEARSD